MKDLFVEEGAWAGDWRLRVPLTGRWATSLATWPVCVARSDEKPGKRVEMGQSEKSLHQPFLFLIDHASYLPENLNAPRGREEPQSVELHGPEQFRTSWLTSKHGSLGSI